MKLNKTNAKLFKEGKVCIRQTTRFTQNDRGLFKYFLSEVFNLQIDEENKNSKFFSFDYFYAGSLYKNSVVASENLPNKQIKVLELKDFFIDVKQFDNNSGTINTYIVLKNTGIALAVTESIKTVFDYMNSESKYMYLNAVNGMSINKALYPVIINKDQIIYCYTVNSLCENELDEIKKNFEQEYTTTENTHDNGNV